MKLSFVVWMAIAGCSAQNGGETAASATSARADALPDGWIRKGSTPDAYTMGVDRENLHEGNAPMTLASKADATFHDGDFGTLLTRVDAAPYHGKRVRIRGNVRAADVAGWAGVWMRVDGAEKKILAFDNMETRAIKATKDWARYDVVLDVDASATQISFGVLLDGRGSVWFDTLALEVVDASVATTGGEATPTFEAASTRGVSAKWFLNGSAASSYVANADATVHHGGSTSVSVASTSAPPAGKFGGAMQMAPLTDALRGSRVRLSAYVKAENVRGWAGLWLRVDGARGTKPLAFDNMHDRPITRSIDWTPYSIELDVPADATNIALGVLLVGEGHVWMDDVVLEPATKP